MKSIFRPFAVFMVFFLLLCIVFKAPAYAEESANDMWTKLGRGANNLVFGFGEISYQMSEYDKTQRTPVAIVGGFFKGVLYGITRTVVGVYEIVTFPVPIPANYRVIMKPDFILPPA